MVQKSRQNRNPIPRPAAASMKQDNKLIRGLKINPLIPTIFHEHWWLDIATGGRFDIAKVTQAGKTVGWLPSIQCQSKHGALYRARDRRRRWQPGNTFFEKTSVLTHSFASGFG